MENITYVKNKDGTLTKVTTITEVVAGTDIDRQIQFYQSRQVSIDNAKVQLQSAIDALAKNASDIGVAVSVDTVAKP